MSLYVDTLSLRPPSWVLAAFCGESLAINTYIICYIPNLRSGLAQKILFRFSRRLEFYSFLWKLFWIWQFKFPGRFLIFAPHSHRYFFASSAVFWFACWYFFEVCSGSSESVPVLVVCLFLGLRSCSSGPIPSHSSVTLISWSSWSGMIPSIPLCLFADAWIRSSGLISRLLSLMRILSAPWSGLRPWLPSSEDNRIGKKSAKTLASSRKDGSIRASIDSFERREALFRAFSRYWLESGSCRRSLEVIGILRLLGTAPTSSVLIRSRIELLYWLKD